MQCSDSWGSRIQTRRRVRAWRHGQHPGGQRWTRGPPARTRGGGGTTARSRAPVEKSRAVVCSGYANTEQARRPPYSIYYFVLPCKLVRDLHCALLTL